MKKEITELMKQKMDSVCSDQRFALREVEDAEKVLDHKNILLKRATQHVADLEELDCLLNKLG